jgi:hypothetical protein
MLYCCVLSAVLYAAVLYTAVLHVAVLCVANDHLLIVMPFCKLCRVLRVLPVPTATAAIPTTATSTASGDDKLVLCCDKIASCGSPSQTNPSQTPSGISGSTASAFTAQDVHDTSCSLHCLSALRPLDMCVSISGYTVHQCT